MFVNSELAENAYESRVGQLVFSDYLWRQLREKRRVNLKCIRGWLREVGKDANLRYPDPRSERIFYCVRSFAKTTADKIRAALEMRSAIAILLLSDELAALACRRLA